MANRPVRDTSGDITRIVLLAALSAPFGPAHGYEVKAKLARWHMHWWADVQSGAIYAGLKRLEREGLIERAGSEQSGNRPVRHIFRITDAGSAELRRLLAQAWRGVTRFSRPIDVALSFYHVLSQAEIEGHLRTRLTILSQLLETFDDSYKPETPDPNVAQMINDLYAHERCLLDTEHEWTEMLLRRFEERAYTAR